LFKIHYLILGLNINLASYDICPELSSESIEFGCDLLYIMKGGTKGSDPKYPISFRNTSIPTAIHAVFKWEPHGTYYAAISHIVTEDKANRNIVPHMVYIY
jgi:hypothetical protein